MGLNDLQTRLLIQLDHSDQTMKITCLSAVMHFAHNYFFVIVLDMGTFGSGISSTLTNLFTMICLQVYCRCSKDEDLHQILSVPLIRVENLEGLEQYLILGLPGIAIVAIDWGSYEILSLWSAAFGIKQQTALILCWNFLDVMAQSECGFQIVMCSYVGK